MSTCDDVRDDAMDRDSGDGCDDTPTYERKPGTRALDDDEGTRLRMERSGLRHKINLLAGRGEEQAKCIERKTEQVEMLRTELVVLRRKHETEVEELRKLLDDRDTRIRSLQELLVRSPREAELSEQLAALKEQLARREEELKLLKAQEETARKAAREENRRSRLAVGRLKDKYERQLAALTAEVERCGGDAKRAVEEVSQRERDIERLSSEISIAKRQSENLERMLREAQHRISTAEADAEEAHRQRRESLAQCEGFQIRAQDSEAQLLSLRSHAEAEAARARGEMEALSKKAAGDVEGMVIRLRRRMREVSEAVGHDVETDEGLREVIAMVGRAAAAAVAPAPSPLVVPAPSEDVTAALTELAEALHCEPEMVVRAARERFNGLQEALRRLRRMEAELERIKAEYAQANRDCLALQSTMNSKDAEIEALRYQCERIEKTRRSEEERHLLEVQRLERALHEQGGEVTRRELEIGDLKARLGRIEVRQGVTV